MNSGGLFFRMGTDRRRVGSGLENSFASVRGSSCFLVGGGPSLREVDVELLERIPAPRMAINLAGTGLIRPNFWTAFDPTSRFSRSTYLDPGIMKFVPARRGRDLVPETNFKVCESPNLYLFEGDRERGFDNFLPPEAERIVDWNDSFVQGLEIVYRLGFRTVYLLGCEFRVAVPAELRTWGAARGVEVGERCGLWEFSRECERRGLKEKLAAVQAGIEPYHFEETKRWEAAVSTDFHYFRVAQYLRLSRRSMSLAGLRVISLTAGSRLNDYFPSCSLEEAAEAIWKDCGNPSAEQTDGRYAGDQDRWPEGWGPMQDFLPLHWGERDQQERDDKGRVDEKGAGSELRRKANVREAVGRLAERERRMAEVIVEEIG